MPLRYGSALCLVALSFLRYGILRDACSRYGYLRYAFLRYASFRGGHLRNRLVAIQLWIDAFMIWTILFLINKGQNYWALIGWDRGHFFLIEGIFGNQERACPLLINK